MDKVYKVFWSQTALDELAGILAYPPEVKEKIYLDAQARLSFMPTLSAKQIPSGILKGYWAKLGLYQVILVFEVNEEKSGVWIVAIKHKRENVYWKEK
ncbi:hypothetical protein PP175_04120 [Aneurinibacillus sp. Ricciae_BoGa-3]|uniref:type II toxin-antitoxin system RelE family toxin n=1 Tax=Aneurinibacillus sp. Ricciae_BoGa-3 TaxID=3022697 RepID=UPI0023411557|nr:hypothetical protein [Aneurinibacillus sp. Ricciae_BoGa-3]WCK55181.1 hypothetical protein PP175_04120 [Aneurinibacillus sp. Ricciae_BoGa-3]